MAKHLQSDGNGTRSRHVVVANALIAVGVALLVVAAGIWLYNQYRYHEQDAETAKLATYVSEPDDDSDGLVGDEGSGGTAALRVDWEGLKALNGDVVAWVQIPGTVVNYPVYQSDDNDYYLHHNAEGRTTVGGQVFLDCDATAPGMVDEQSVIYGHHLRNGAMFQPIWKMDRQDVFDATPTVWYLTERASFELEPLLLYYTTPDDSSVRTFAFQDEDEFHQYLMDRLGRAVTKRADAERIISGVSHVLTLSTCNYYDGYGRTELVCVPKDEAAAATGGVSS